MPRCLCRGTCGLTSVLTRCVVQITWEIPLIIMIRVEVLSTGNSHFTRAWKVGPFHGAWNFSLRFATRFGSVRSQFRFTIAVRRIIYFLNFNSYSSEKNIEIIAKLAELYGLINYLTDLQSFNLVDFAFYIHFCCLDLNILLF